MLIKLYAAENPETHFTSLAPGLIDTAMQDYLCAEVDTSKFKAVQRLKDARDTEAMPKPPEAARKLIDAFPKMLFYESGHFADIRKLSH